MIAPPMPCEGSTLTLGSSGAPVLSPMPVVSSSPVVTSVVVTGPPVLASAPVLADAPVVADVGSPVVADSPVVGSLPVVVGVAVVAVVRPVLEPALPLPGSVSSPPFAVQVASRIGSRSAARRMRQDVASHRPLSTST